MLPPEVLRVLLLIGLAATGYMLIQAWNEDYIKNADPVTYSAAPEVSGGGDVAPSVAPVQSAAAPNSTVRAFTSTKRKQVHRSTECTCWR